MITELEEEVPARKHRQRFNASCRQVFRQAAGRPGWNELRLAGAMGYSAYRTRQWMRLKADWPAQAIGALAEAADLEVGLVWAARGRLEKADV